MARALRGWESRLKINIFKSLLVDEDQLTTLAAKFTMDGIAAYGSSSMTVTKEEVRVAVKKLRPGGVKHLFLLL